MMRLNKAQAVCMAVLFASGAPVEQQKLAETLECDPETVRKIQTSLNDFLEESNLPFTIIPLADSFQIVLKSEYTAYARQTLEMRRNMPLSPAAMEVLAIIAYNQPVTRGFVEQIRGVDSASVVSLLAEKELIEEAGRLDLPGRPIAYRTTANFLRVFSLTDLSELPQIIAEEADALPEDDNLEGQVAFEK